MVDDSGPWVSMKAGLGWQYGQKEELGLALTLCLHSKPTVIDIMIVEQAQIACLSEMTLMLMRKQASSQSLICIARPIKIIT